MFSQPFSTGDFNGYGIIPYRKLMFSLSVLVFGLIVSCNMTGVKTISKYVCMELMVMCKSGNNLHCAPG